MTAIDDIAAERKRQIESEGWSADHDDGHNYNQIAKAAAMYALPEITRRAPLGTDGETILERLWPWDSKWWKPGNRRRDLVRAGALIVAEIERLDRAAARNAA